MGRVSRGSWGQRRSDSNFWDLQHHVRHRSNHILRGDQTRWEENLQALTPLSWGVMPPPQKKKKSDSGGTTGTGAPLLKIFLFETPEILSFERNSLLSLPVGLSLQLCYFSRLVWIVNWKACLSTSWVIIMQDTIFCTVTTKCLLIFVLLCN